LTLKQLERATGASGQGKAFAIWLHSSQERTRVTYGNRSNLLDAQQKDTMITMEWLSFPWLKQDLTSAFWRQTPLYLGIDSTVELWMLF